LKSHSETLKSARSSVSRSQCVVQQSSAVPNVVFSAAESLARSIDRKSKFPSDRSAEADRTLEELNLGHSRRTGCTIFLAYTSNMITSGIREIIRFLVQHKMVDVLVTSAGGIEEDFVKCMAPFYVGDFSKWTGSTLRSLGINRTGNLLVPNTNYVSFEDWLIPIFDQLLKEQNEQNINWTPSKIIDQHICLANFNGIPVFCPGITDGALGDVLFSHSYRSSGLRVDVAEDVRRINCLAVYSYATGVIILGGGIIKHHTLNANLMRNGADYCLYVNTGEEFDGSDSGARPDEAVSWGKLGSAAEPVKVHADATLIFPLLVAQTFHQG
uniref:deoxyhypusine synthase n=1 Tax=Schistocephalus solidus TaxID=70667 RepID=A0A183TAL5_SCHSO